VQCATADPDGRKRALLIGGGIANFTDVAATFNGIIQALREKVNWTAKLDSRSIPQPLPPVFI
jgi:ATP citrate (pro-S)-lyase